MIKIPHKLLREGHSAIPNRMVDNRLGIRVHCDVNPLIAKFFRVAAPNVSRFLLHEAPQLIDLKMFAGNSAHRGIEQAFAAFSSKNQQPHNRVAVQASKSFRAANGATFDQLQRPCSGFRAGPHGSKNRLRLRLGKGATAGIAAPSLDATLTEVPESLAGLVLASEAGHGQSPLDFSAEKAHNELGSRSWLTPRFGLAPQPVQAGSGALNVSGCGLRWHNGNFHRRPLRSESNHNQDFHCSPSSRKRSVLSAQSVSHLTPKWSFLFVPLVVELLPDQRSRTGFLLPVEGVVALSNALTEALAGRGKDFPYPCKAYPLVFRGSRGALFCYDLFTFDEPVDGRGDRRNRCLIFVQRKPQFLKQFLNFVNSHPFLARRSHR